MATSLKYVRLGYGTPMSGEMAVLRLLSFPLLCWFGFAVGRGTASLVWGIIYVIDSRVISDDVYHSLSADVRWWGGVAGLGSAVAVNCLPLLWPFAAAAIIPALSIFTGIVGGMFGWKHGLVGYFGAHVAVIIGCTLLAGIEFRNRVRFSLRALLIITTVVAIVLGVIAVAIR